jgi:hypothetical protein
MKWLFQEPDRDPRLCDALRAIEQFSSRDDGQLRQRIMEAAGPRLADLRSVSPKWWEWITRWMPVAVPIGLAASLAAALLVPGSDEVSLSSAYSTEAAADSTLVIAAFSEAPAGGQLAAHLVAPEPGDWLLEEAVAR